MTTARTAQYTCPPSAAARNAAPRDGSDTVGHTAATPSNNLTNLTNLTKRRPLLAGSPVPPSRAQADAADTAVAEQAVTGIYATIGGSIALMMSTWNAAHTEGERRTRLLAFARTLVGLLLLRFFMASAVIGAAAAGFHPAVARIFMKMVDDMMNGLLGNACYVKRYVLPVAMLVGFVLFPSTLANVPFVATVCDIVAFKLGAELMLKNHAKETRMVKVDVTADE